MNTLVAFDKFKDSMTADLACQTACEVILSKRRDWRIQTAPLTDGGEGFARIMTEAKMGHVNRLHVRGPLFTEIPASFGMVDLARVDTATRAFLRLPDSGRLAIIEMAQSSGLESVPQAARNAWRTSSIGTGDTISYAIEIGADAILLGIGGSATSDLGFGALESLGARFLRADGTQVRHITPERWSQVDAIDLSRVSPRTIPVRIACDVENPLLGDNGAAAVYGPQKGIPKDQITTFDEAAGDIARRFLKAARKDERALDEVSAGAAGGIGFGLKAVLHDAAFVPGFELVTRWLNLEEKAKNADLIITGEGSFDKSSLQGKGPGKLIDWAKASDIPVWIFAGRMAPEIDIAAIHSKARAHAISPVDMPLEEALANGPKLLRASLENAVDAG